MSFLNYDSLKSIKLKIDKCLNFLILAQNIMIIGLKILLIFFKKKGFPHWPFKVTVSSTFPLFATVCKFIPSLSEFAMTVTVNNVVVISVLLSILLWLYQCYCQYSCGYISVTVNTLVVISLLLSILLWLYQCYTKYCCGYISVILNNVVVISVLH